MQAVEINKGSAVLDRQASDTAMINTARWQQHTRLIRGNPVRVYRGPDWRRER